MNDWHRIYLASAGTGKTYRLSGRFLDLLLANAEPKSILATTFTRKAAEEILVRVLKRLVKMVDSAKDRQELAKDRDFGSEFDAGDALALLIKLVHNLHRFEVRTLDSFFNHMARLFTLELGLPSGWSVAQGQEADEVTAEALGQLLAGVHGREEEEQFAELLRELASSNGAGRAIYPALANLVEKGRERFLDSPAQAWRCVQSDDRVGPEEAGRLASEIKLLDVPCNKGDKKPKKLWLKAQTAMDDALTREDWKDLLTVTLFKNFLGGSYAYDRVPIEGPWLDALAEVREYVTKAMCAALAVRNARAFELLKRYEAILKDVKRERGRYEFSDITRLLAPVDGLDPIKSRGFDLAWRMDATLHHLLLDEFQDTAPMQWRVLDAMAEEVCAVGGGEKSFFCVGDKKQSIYGWRSAEPRLLSSLEQRLNLQAKSLEKNYRSSPLILETVDQVFENVGSLSVFSDPDKQVHAQAAARFQENYKGHTAAKDLQGVAELRQAAPAADGQKKWEPVVELAVERVVALSEELTERCKMAGRPQVTIGVLVRSNKVIPSLIKKLQDRGVLASGEGGNPLTDSAAVLHFLSLLHLADHPSDSVAAFHLSTSPLPAALGCADPMADPRGLSRLVRERMSRDGVDALCSYLERAVQTWDGYSTWDLRRYRQLGDLAFAQSDRMWLRADRFVDLVRQHKVEDPAASRIKVMTVHASKGLEFDVVVLPELDIPLTYNRWPFLTSRPEPRGMLTAVTLNPGKQAAMLDPDLQALFEEQSMRDVEEALCVLYVGMTRTRHHLEMLVRDPGRKDGGATPAGILRAALVDAAPDGQLLWRHPDSCDSWLPEPKVLEDPGAEGAVDQAPVAADPKPALAPSHALRRSLTLAPSKEEGGTTALGADLLKPPAKGNFWRGSLVHRYLEAIEWPGEAALDMDALLAIGAEVNPDEGRRRAAFGYLRKALAKPDIRAALSRRAGSDEEEVVWRERRFCVEIPGQGQCEGAFDRVVLTRDAGGQVTAAVIQDYKTDTVAADLLDEMVAHYAPQLVVYRRALAVMTGLAESAIGAELLFLSLGCVRTVAS